MSLGIGTRYAAPANVARVFKIFFHDACFDGTTSAALFAAFYRDAIDRTAEPLAVGMVHRDGNPFEGVTLDADDHACVDFRFCADPRMRWWFDHHATTFQPPTLREVYEREHLPTWFFDAAAPSCASLIGRVLGDGWGWQPPPHLVEAVRWADRIDAAQFATPEEAVALTTPAQRLAAWLAHGRTPADTVQYIGWLSQGSLAEVAARPELAAELATVEVERARELEAVARIGVWHGDVIVLDRFAEPGLRSPGFLAYLLFPACLYAVAATSGSQHIKISVGANPWSTKPRRHHIGELCARFGGGGHAAVGGVTLRPDEHARAREAMTAIVNELAST
jgi:hypothetical protein